MRDRGVPAIHVDLAGGRKSVLAIVNRRTEAIDYETNQSSGLASELTLLTADLPSAGISQGESIELEGITYLVDEVEQARVGTVRVSLIRA